MLEKVPVQSLWIPVWHRQLPNRDPNRPDRYLLAYLLISDAKQLSRETGRGTFSSIPSKMPNRDPEEQEGTFSFDF